MEPVLSQQVMEVITRPDPTREETEKDSQSVQGLTHVCESMHTEKTPWLATF